MIILHLEDDEAEVLMLILERIGGDYNRTGRKHADDIQAKLNGLGVVHSRAIEDAWPISPERCSIHFTEVLK